MNVLARFTHVLRLLWYFLWSFPIRLYRLPRKLVYIIYYLFRGHFTGIDLARELLALGMLGFDVAGLPELYDIAGLFMKAKIRGLSPKERDLIDELFPGALPVHLIKVDPSARMTARRLNIAYVSVFTINYHETLSEKTFVHELIHIWQYHRFGSEYIPQAIAAQHSHAGYDYGGLAQLFQSFGESQKITDFNFEQQGDILADFYELSQQCKKDQSPNLQHAYRMYRYFTDQLATLKVYRW